eukprot:TRINITY_DN9372_c1_g1_i1.p1 TRINITY_DN9372_c1_g1~~TRINITY_DN9372_c1_g1_i1.p1  ORF type:complete len:713 (+),score=104.67 TRINITY_DN9372_c1_g1_i1:103-2241(+)
MPRPSRVPVKRSEKKPAHDRGENDEDPAHEMMEKTVKSTKKVLASALFTVVFYVLFIASMTLHHVTDETYNVRKTFTAIRDLQQTSEIDGKVVVSQGWNQITSLSSMTLWLRDSFVPVLWNEGRLGRGLVLDANRVIGGIFLQQEQLEQRSCKSEKKRPKLFAIYNSTCYKEETLSIAALTRVGPSAQTYKGKHVYWLDISQNLTLVQAHLDKIISAGWASIATKKVAAQSVLFNAQLEVFVLFEATFEVSRPGSLIAQSELWTLPEFVYEDGAASWTMWTDLSFCFCLSCITFLEILHFVDYYRAGSLRAYIFSLYRLASVFVIIGGVSFMSVFYWVSNEIEDLTNRVGRLVEAPGTMEDYMPGEAWSEAWISRHEGLNELFNEMARLSQALRWTQLAALWYSLAMILRLCEGFELSPNLGSVIRTIRVCIIQLLYFIVVFMVVFFNFALSAHFLFGHILAEWSTKFVAMSSAFRAIMGDLDFMAMYDIAPVSTLTWFILFVICIVFVLVNQFIVIIMDAYQEVQSQNDMALEAVSKSSEHMNEGKLEKIARLVADRQDGSEQENKDNESRHKHERGDFFGLPQELDVSQHAVHPQLPHTPEESQSTQIPVNLQSKEGAEDEQTSTHLDSLSSTPDDSSKERSLQTNFEHDPKHSADRDALGTSLQSQHARRQQLPLQAHIVSYKSHRELPTVQARVASRPLEIIVKAKPL